MAGTGPTAGVCLIEERVDCMQLYKLRSRRRHKTAPAGERLWRAYASNGAIRTDNDDDDDGISCMIKLTFVTTESNFTMIGDSRFFMYNSCF